MTESRPLALAHRGARLLAAENTLNAFELGLQQGCDGFECDLRLTRDGRVVFCHDPVFAGLSVADSEYESLVAAARKADANGLPAGEILPCLEDVIPRFVERAYIDLDLKVRGMAKMLVEALGAHRKNILVSSFLPEVLAEVRRRDSSMALGWICDDKTKLQRWPQIACEVLVVDLPLVTSELVEQAHLAGSQLLVWAAESEEQIQRVAELGVEGIISGHTELLVRTLRRSKARAAALGR